MPAESGSARRQEAPTDLATHLDRAAASLAAASAVTIVAHQNPDADTLGSALALARALDQLKIRNEVVCDSEWPTTLAFLPGMSSVRREPHQSPDAIVFIDCASQRRAGPMVSTWASDMDAPIVNIDHHTSNDGYGAVNCVGPSAAATSEIVADLIHRLDVKFDSDIATLLLAGLLHDTDRLSIADTSADTLRRAADLVDAGADIGSVSTELFGQRPLSALHLWGQVAGSLETEDGGRIVIGTVSSSMLERAGAMMLDAEDLPELVASVRGASIAILLREIGPTETRASIRTHGSIDAAAIAGRFGGGGHARAAGCTIDAELQSARLGLIEAARESLTAAGLAAPPESSPRGQRVGNEASSPSRHDGGMAFTLWFTGLSGAGKTTISRIVEAHLRRRGVATELLDGDVVRTHLSAGLGFSRQDRDINIRRIGWVCELLNRHAVVAIVAAVSPYRVTRDEVRSRIPRFVEVHVDAPVEVLERRDTKGMYRQTRSGEMTGLTGVDDPYEAPLSPEVRCFTDGRETPEQSAARVIETIERLGYL